MIGCENPLEVVIIVEGNVGELKIMAASSTPQVFELLDHIKPNGVALAVTGSGETEVGGQNLNTLKDFP